MQSGFEKNTAPLNSNDRKLLKERMTGYLIFVVLVVIMAVVFFKFLPDERIVLWVFSIFFLFIFGILSWLIGSIVIDLGNNFKYITKGIITEKISRISRKTTSIRRMIVVNSERFYIEYTDYKKLQAGDTVEISYGPKSKLTINLYIINTIASYQATHKNKFKSDEGTDITIVSLNHNDRRTIKKRTFRSLKFYLYTLLFLSWIIVGLSVSGMYGILLFLFPIPLAFVIVLYQISKRLLKMQQDLKSGKKRLAETIITNKETVMRRAVESNYITTDCGTFKLSQKLFDGIQGGEYIKLHLAIKSNFVIAIEKRDHIEYNT